VRGERTPQIFVKTNEAVGRCIPGSRAVVIPDAAHTMSYQNPRAFNREVLAFIAKQK
jgi:pimeloyl-ACP methyl ester carboxylesterase